MKTKKSSLIASLAAVFATVCFPAERLGAQSQRAHRWDESLMRLPGAVEPPAPEVAVSVATREAVAPRRPSATFTFGDGQKITARSRTGRFRLVGLRAGEVVDVDLQLPNRLSANFAMAQPLDGGKLISFSKGDVGLGGLASIRFQAGHQPGLYRVFVPGFGAPWLLQFWVADPKNPRANPPVMNPEH